MSGPTDTTETTWKPLLCLDFDGVLHSYTNGWTGADEVLDPPVPGAIEFLREAVEHFKVAIYSSRSHQDGGILAMQDWLRRWAYVEGQGGDGWEAEIDWPTEKPPAFVTLDDRAIQFNGTWPSMESLKRFKPWNKREHGPNDTTGTTLPPPSILKAEEFVRFIRRHFSGVGDATSVVVMDLDVRQVDGEAWLLTPKPGDSVTRFDDRREHGLTDFSASLSQRAAFGAEMERAERADEKMGRLFPMRKEGDFMAWAKDSLSKPIPGVSGPSDSEIPVTPEEDEAWTEKGAASHDKDWQRDPWRCWKCGGDLIDYGNACKAGCGPISDEQRDERKRQALARATARIHTSDRLDGCMQTLIQTIERQAKTVETLMGEVRRKGEDYRMIFSDLEKANARVCEMEKELEEARKMVHDYLVAKITPEGVRPTSPNAQNFAANRVEMGAKP